MVSTWRMRLFFGYWTDPPTRRRSDRTHVEWCRSFIKVLDVLKEYIMKHHTTGLAWNPKVSRCGGVRQGEMHRY